MKKNRISSYEIGEIADWDATEISNKIRAKEISEREVLNDVYARLESVNPIINATTAIIPQSKVKPSSKNNSGPFHGVPTFIKDLMHVKGLTCQQGSQGVPSQVSKKTDAAIKQVLHTGCTVIGKSTTSEFGYLPSTETLAHGNTLNPINIEYSTGGSSGGAGALVASGVVPIAHAMDGGGSIRIPASCCGLVGLKTSRNRHVESVTSKLPIDIVCDGIVSRSVRDQANYCYAIEQYKKSKKMQAIGLVEGPAKKRLRIAVFTNAPGGVHSHPEVENAVLKSAQECEKLGHEVSYIENPFRAQYTADFLVYYSFLASLNMRFGKVVYGRKFSADKLEPFSQTLGEYFNGLMFVAPASFKRLKKDLVNDYNALFDTYDVLMSPTLSQPVPKIGYLGPHVEFVAMIMKLSGYTNFTTVNNATGSPAISLPMAKCENGLPIGVQFAAQVGQERTILELSYELEEAKTFIKY